MDKKISECPHCGDNYGFCRIVYMVGKGIYNHPFPDRELTPEEMYNSMATSPIDLVDNSQLHDDLSYRENKTAFCINCQKPIKELKMDE